MGIDSTSISNPVINDATIVAKPADGGVQLQATARMYDDVFAAQRQGVNFVAQDRSSSVLPSLQIVGQCGADGANGNTLLYDAQGNVYASCNDYGQIANIQRGDGSFVEDIHRDTDGTTVTGLAITKDGQLVTRLQIGDNVSSLTVSDNGDITAVTADGTDTYKLDGTVVHTP